MTIEPLCAECLYAHGRRVLYVPTKGTPDFLGLDEAIELARRSQTEFLIRQGNDIVCVATDGSYAPFPQMDCAAFDRIVQEQKRSSAEQWHIAYNRNAQAQADAPKRDEAERRENGLRLLGSAWPRVQQGDMMLDFHAVLDADEIKDIQSALPPSLDCYFASIDEHDILGMSYGDFQETLLPLIKAYRTPGHLTGFSRQERSAPLGQQRGLTLLRMASWGPEEEGKMRGAWMRPLSQEEISQVKSVLCAEEPVEFSIEPMHDVSTILLKASDYHRIVRGRSEEKGRSS